MPDLDTPLKRLLPADVARKLATHRQITTARQLLWFLPRDYLDLRTQVADLVPGSYAVFTGTVLRASSRPMRNRRGRMLNVTVASGTEEIDVTFFSAHGHERALVPGVSGLFAGTVSEYGQRLQLAHPAYEIVDQIADKNPDQNAGDEAAPGGTAAAGATASAAWGIIPDVARQRYMPVYREVKNLPTWTLARSVALVLTSLAPLADPVPPDILQRRDLPGLQEAFALVHSPPSMAAKERGLARLRYDEALTLQVALAQRRQAHRRALAIPRRPVAGGLLEAFDARLPFPLTDGQRRVGEELARDLARRWPMHRLLQGEVGSGKTVVALRAMLAVIDAGGQAALLAPTEVLAAQHHRSITTLLGDMALGGMLGGAEHATNVALVTGSMSASARKSALLQAASGQAGIVVGTHALLEERVQFADLGLVVVDEQHRFGVAQRDALRGKAQDTEVHVLVMTATPIPRTVAMTVFGDMDTSVLSELPAGRSPIASHVVDNPAWYERAWDRVAEEVARGHQVYVVCPRIGDDTDTPTGRREGREAPEETVLPEDTNTPDAADLLDPSPRTPSRSVLDMHEELAAHPRLSGLRIEMLHGRLPPETKDAVMTEFAAGQIDILVATTVIEVGVDVPNATVMVVMDAERFGVSQLHQLRGRVGRGSAPGLCLLVSDTDNPSTRERLTQVAATVDGFELARLDLEYRREGDVLGARQSGRGSLRLLRLLRDEHVIAQARHDATQLVDQDPQLSSHPELAAALAAMLDDDQAAYLERG